MIVTVRPQDCLRGVMGVRKHPEPSRGSPVRAVWPVESRDACLGEVEGVSSACCGHGLERGFRCTSR